MSILCKDVLIDIKLTKLRTNIDVYKYIYIRGLFLNRGALPEINLSVSVTGTWC